MEPAVTGAVRRCPPRLPRVPPRALAPHRVRLPALGSLAEPHSRADEAGCRAELRTGVEALLELSDRGGQVRLARAMRRSLLLLSSANGPQILVPLCRAVAGSISHRAAGQLVALLARLRTRPGRVRAARPPASHNRSSRVRRADPNHLAA